MSDTEILIAVQCGIMFFQLIVFIAQLVIAKRQKEILKTQEERNRQNLKIIQFGEAAIWYDEMIGLDLGITLAVFNRSILGNAIKEIRILLTNLPSNPFSRPFIQSFPPYKIEYLSDDRFHLSEQIQYLNIQERTFDELRAATAQIKIVIVDVFDKPFEHVVKIESGHFDGDGRLRKWFENREEI